MKVTILKTIPGTCDGQWLVGGTVVDINKKTATFLVERGEAEPYPKPDPEPKPEPEIRTAEVKPPRNAAARTTKPTPRQWQKD